MGFKRKDNGEEPPETPEGQANYEEAKRRIFYAMKHPMGRAASPEMPALYAVTMLLAEQIETNRLLRALVGERGGDVGAPIPPGEPQTAEDLNDPDVRPGMPM